MRWWTRSRAIRTASSCSSTRPAASAISPASPPVIRKCGATSVSPIARRCCRNWPAISASWPRLSCCCKRATRQDWKKYLRGRALHATNGCAGNSESALPWRHPRLTALDYLDLAPIRGVSGTVKLPGSKSISNRVLLLAALASGETRLHDLLDSDDTRVMLDALRMLGIGVKQDDGATVVTGAGGAFPGKAAELFLGNAGTAFRPLTAALALCDGEYRLSGVARMHERPIGDLVDALRGLGAAIDYLASAGYPPLHIKPATINAGGKVSVRGDVSSQFLSALLMV